MKNLLFLGPEEIRRELVLPDGFALLFIDSSQKLAHAIKDAYGILDASMKYRITDEMIRSAEKLQMISTATTGSDHIDRDEISKRRIAVCTLKDDREFLKNITPAAEHSWALLLACARRIPSAYEHVKAGGWDRESFPGIMIRGKQLGIIGCGRIGSWMSKYGNAFGMRVVGHDPYVDVLPSGITKMDLESLLSTSDFISLHIHLSEENKNFLSSDRIKSMKKGAVLINTSRGALLDENALCASLLSGHIGAAGVDVLVGEPHTENNVLLHYARTHTNLIITPHCGGFSPEAVLLVTQHALNKILNHHE